MRILFLGPAGSPILAFLESTEASVVRATDPLGQAFLDSTAADFLVSYGYRHILRQDVLDRFPERAVNLHISLLPWNRGADPNTWSFADDTPKGVTIHRIDAGVDTGEILFQARVQHARTDTLATSYQRLAATIEELFFEHWPAIRDGSCTPTAQHGGGTLHRMRDKEQLAHLLSAGYDTKAAILESHAVDLQLSRRFWQKLASS
jgi:methionyl-tRNA formyltransferase